MTYIFRITGSVVKVLFDASISYVNVYSPHDDVSIVPVCTIKFEISIIVP